MNCSIAAFTYMAIGCGCSPRDFLMPILLLLLFPFLELALLIKVGGVIGVLPTLLLIVASAVIGSMLLRVAGLATALRAREKLARGEAPEQEMLEGMLIAVGGGLFLLPGFLSDGLGLVCLLPFTRRMLVRRLLARMQEQAIRQRAFADDLAARDGPARPNVIEGEFERRDD